MTRPLAGHDRSPWTGALLALGLVALSLAAPTPAHAVRPFVTDDARITDYGQLEMEAWVDLVGAAGAWSPSLNAMFGVTFTDWMQVIVGGGVGFDHLGAFSVANPVIQPKILLLGASEDGVPGIAIAAGITLPLGTGGLYDDATGLYLVAPVTFRLFADALLIHLNIGARGAISGEGELSVRPYWGVGFDLALGIQEVRLIGEAYAGDPLEVPGAEYAFQWGLRWIASDYVNLDLTFGTQPEHPPDELHGPEFSFWGQVGFRILVDAFTRGGQPGSPLGAVGAIETESVRREREREAAEHAQPPTPEPETARETARETVPETEREAEPEAAEEARPDGAGLRDP